jgi:hypothetical protein
MILDQGKLANGLVDKACFERGCACYDSRNKGECVEVVEKRTWQGLAAEDRLTAKYMQDAPDGIEAVIDYIEAKLKEKNT